MVLQNDPVSYFATRKKSLHDAVICAQVMRKVQRIKRELSSDSDASISSSSSPCASFTVGSPPKPEGPAESPKRPLRRRKRPRRARKACRRCPYAECGCQNVIEVHRTRPKHTVVVTEQPEPPVEGVEEYVQALLVELSEVTSDEEDCNKWQPREHREFQQERGISGNENIGNIAIRRRPAFRRCASCEEKEIKPVPRNGSFSSVEPVLTRNAVSWAFEGHSAL